ncbi:ABC transporter permease [Paracoccus cavernae]|uniref:ABC transporter permease n=1 Tax=Paracoccus cavernae TaxID=1571207 RepID=A0ABT8D696_9RHOB|nr:ABC transporter permease [Paracoccus cavernae]
MTRWILGRMGRALLTLLLLISFTFFALKISADPALQILGPDAGPDAISAFREKWGLNAPLWQQFLIYLGNVLQFDLGLSYRTNEPALDLVLSRVPATLALMIPTTLLALALGVPLGIWAAYTRGTIWDRGITLLSIIGFAIPNFLIGVLLIYLFRSSWAGCRRRALSTGAPISCRCSQWRLPRPRFFRALPVRR